MNLAGLTIVITQCITEALCTAEDKRYVKS